MAERIMIFDDDPDILLVTATILRRKGYEVSCREDCTELEKDISSFDPAIILMDNWMPSMTGLDAIKHIKTIPAFQHIPIIFFSANSNLEALATEAGADKLLKKPFDVPALETLIAGLLSN